MLFWCIWDQNSTKTNAIFSWQKMVQIHQMTGLRSLGSDSAKWHWHWCQLFFSHSPAANRRDLSTDNDIDTDSATDAVWQSFGIMLCCLRQALYWESAMIVRSAIVLEKCYVALVIHCIWKIWALNYYGKCLVHRYVIAPDEAHTVIYISSHYHQWLAK